MGSSTPGAILTVGMPGVKERLMSAQKLATAIVSGNVGYSQVPGSFQQISRRYRYLAVTYDARPSHVCAVPAEAWSPAPGIRSGLHRLSLVSAEPQGLAQDYNHLFIHHYWTDGAISNNLLPLLSWLQL